ncbi:MAG: hypothetical protein KAV87_06305 [Desulfobacteraceae bacterium]|nr:hypothetical protein [Desulfobacteraceae bacterium]
MEHYKNRYWLRKMYLVDGFSSDEIGDLCGVNGRTIRYYFKKFGIKLEKNNSIMGKDIHVLLPNRLHENLKKHCKYKKRTISSVTRMALIEFLVKNNLNPYKED